MSDETDSTPIMIDDRRYSYHKGTIVYYGDELEPFTLRQALTWAKRNCNPETIKRLRSRAACDRLVQEVETLQTLLAEAFSELNSCGDQQDTCFIEHTHYCVRCDSSIDRNATIRNKIHAHLVNES